MFSHNKALTLLLAIASGAQAFSPASYGASTVRNTDLLLLTSCRCSSVKIAKHQAIPYYVKKIHVNFTLQQRRPRSRHG